MPSECDRLHFLQVQCAFAAMSRHPRARSTRLTVERHGLTWPRIYYDSSPTRNPRTWKLLTDLGDDSRHYLF